MELFCCEDAVVQHQVLDVGNLSEGLPFVDIFEGFFGLLDCYEVAFFGEILVLVVVVE